MTKISFENIQEGQKRLADMLDFINSVPSVLNDSAGYYLSLAKALDMSSKMLSDVISEREFLYITLIILMLDNGVYDFSIDRGTANSMTEYGLDIELDENVVKLSIRFPEEKNEDTTDATV